MKIIAALGSEECAAAMRVFLEGARTPTEVMAVAVVPRRNRLSTVLELSRRREHQSLQELQRLEQSHASQLLSEFRSQVERPGLTVETSVTVGNPAEELNQAARSWGAELILVTRRKTSGDESEHLGHVAGRVARYAPCSVLVLDPSRPSPRVVLLATDGSPQAEIAGRRLLQMPLKDRTSLLICTVMPTFAPAFVKSGSLDYREYQRLLSEIEDQEKTAAQEILDRTAAGFRGAPFRVRQLAYTGDTTGVLLRVIQESNVELLALGAKGMSSAAGFLLGSVTLRLLNRATCSILVAR